MRKHNFLITFTKKLNLLINKLLIRNLNKLNLYNFLNIAKSNKFFFTFVALIVLCLLYISIPNTYDRNDVSKELQNQLQNKLNLQFNLSKNFKYDFFPRPHFTYSDASVLIGQDKISQIKNLKIYISLNNLFSLNNTKINNLILTKSNINLNKENYDFFSQILSQDLADLKLKIKDSNIFYRNNDGQVLFINKVKNLNYYYDIKDSKNILEAENEIFNLPYTFEISKKKNEKKIFSKLNLNFFKLQIENNLDYNNGIKKGFQYLKTT